MKVHLTNDCCPAVDPSDCFPCAFIRRARPSTVAPPLHVAWLAGLTAAVVLVTIALTMVL